MNKNFQKYYLKIKYAQNYNSYLNKNANETSRYKLKQCFNRLSEIQNNNNLNSILIHRQA